MLWISIATQRDMYTYDIYNYQFLLSFILISVQKDLVLIFVTGVLFVTSDGWHLIYVYIYIFTRNTMSLEQVIFMYMLMRYPSLTSKLILLSLISPLGMAIQLFFHSYINRSHFSIQLIWYSCKGCFRSLHWAHTTFLYIFLNFNEHYTYFHKRSYTHIHTKAQDIHAYRKKHY